MRVRVKFCGVTTADDAAAAVDAGAQLVGLNFVPGTPRALGLDEAEAVSARVAGWVERVAVFRDAEPEAIDRVLRRIDVERVQFHGSESPESLSRYAMPTIKALKGVDLEAARKFPGSMLLLDHPIQAAGSGAAWDYAGAREIVAAGRDVILAGGLGPDNVALALRALGGVLPWGVDVASGIESEKRRKDPNKMREFVKVVREVEESL